MLNPNQRTRIHVARELIALAEQLLSTIEDEIQHTEITRSILVLKGIFVKLGDFLK